MKKLSLVLVLVGIVITSSSFRKRVHSHKKKAMASAVSKSLDFPVSGKRNNIGGFWGDSRDGGIRKHKGIDIFATKGTPVVAISNGVIAKRANTPIGGKTLWLQPKNYSWKAYYAHLDKQLVKKGQYVKKGQVIGTVGNTGNARTTPSHLHFGIRPGKKGWVNPLPYVKNSPKVAAKISSKHKVTITKKHSGRKRK